MNTFKIPLPLNRIDSINQPPAYYVDVQNYFIIVCGVLWTTAYILYIRQGSRDKSYGMPILPLCANLGWEIIYGIFYPLSVAETITFVPWIAIDLGIAYTTIRFASREWKHSPLIANHIVLLIFSGTLTMTLIHWAFIVTSSSVDDAAFWAGFVCQVLLGYASVFHLLSRHSTRGHSISIWLCRWLGTVAPICMFRWRYAHYPNDYSVIGTPMATLLFILAETADILYIITYLSLKRSEEKKIR